MFTAQVKMALFLGFSIVAASAQAATWDEFRITVPHASLYFDADTVIRIGSTVSVWVKNVQDEAHPSPDGVAFVVGHEVFNCANRTYQFQAASSYTKNGQDIESDEIPTTVNEIIPGTVNEAELKAVCQSDFPRLDHPDLYHGAE